MPSDAWMNAVYPCMPDQKIHLLVNLRKLPLTLYASSPEEDYDVPSFEVKKRIL